MIYVFLANGFEEVEAFAPVDLMRRAGLNVQTVGVGGRTVTGSHGICTVADLADTELNLQAEPAQLVVLPGGLPGTTNLEASEIVHQAVDTCLAQGGYVGAICAAPSVLGHLGILKGHTAVCYPGFESELGCALGDASVVQSGKITTAKGAGVAIDFGLQLVSVLCGPEKAAQIRSAIQCP